MAIVQRIPSSASSKTLPRSSTRSTRRCSCSATPMEPSARWRQRCERTSSQASSSTSRPSTVRARAEFLRNSWNVWKRFLSPVTAKASSQHLWARYWDFAGSTEVLAGLARSRRRGAHAAHGSFGQKKPTDWPPTELASCRYPSYFFLAATAPTSLDGSSPSLRKPSRTRAP